jgi:hypothetical protein
MQQRPVAVSHVAPVQQWEFAEQALSIPVPGARQHRLPSQADPGPQQVSSHIVHGMQTWSVESQ